MALLYLASAYANAAINGIVAPSTTFYLSLHSATPLNTGANELVAGTDYTAVSGGRPPITFGTAVAGVQTSNDTQTFAILTNQASGINWFGIWTAKTAGTYICGGLTVGLGSAIPVGASVVFTNGVVLEVQG